MRVLSLSFQVYACKFRCCLLGGTTKKLPSSLVYAHSGYNMQADNLTVKIV